MTNILTRTMDLVHEYNDVTCVHTFSFDTTYPVKVSGNIIKTFVATADFHKDDIFVVDNGDGMYTTIPFENIYGFRQQLNVEEYFTVGEPVMVVFKLTTDGTPGTATICKLSPVQDTSNQGLYIKYMCNDIDDSEKLRAALEAIYNARMGDTINVLGCQLTTGSARDVTIEITGKFKLVTESIHQNVDDNDRKRYFSYINIAPENPDPFFTVRLDFSRAVLDTGGVLTDLINKNLIDEEIGYSKTGHHIYLFEFGNVESRPKLYVDNLRMDSSLLGLFVSNNKKVTTSTDSDVALTIDTAYAKFSGIRYLDTTQTSTSTVRYGIAKPSPIFVDNISPYTTVDLCDIDMVDITLERFNLIVNSGICNIDKITLYYGIPNSLAVYKLHHIQNTLDSLIVNCPTTFNSNDIRRYTSPVLPAVLQGRHIQFDRSNIREAQGFGFIFNEISLADITDVTPKMSIVNAEGHIEYHNIISNIGGDLIVKTSSFEMKPLNYNTDYCYENSIIMTYGGTVSVHTTDFNMNSTDKGLYGIHVMPIRKTLPTSASDLGDYIAANLTCEGCKFFCDKHTDTIFQSFNNRIEPSPDPVPTYEEIIRSAAVAFCITSYMPKDINGINSSGGTMSYVNPYDSVGLCTITGCDFSASYRTGSPVHRISSVDFMNMLLNFGAPIDIMHGFGIMYARGNTQFKISGCSTGMNGLSDGTAFSNCPTYGFYIINTQENGAMTLTDSNINACTHTLVYRPNLDEYTIRQICFSIAAGETTGLTPAIADFDLDGTISANDAVVGIEYLKHRTCPALTVANSIIKNGFCHYGDMPIANNDYSTTKFPFVVPDIYVLSNRSVEKRAKVFPGIYAEKISSSTMSNVRFECHSVCVNPVAIETIVTMANCDFMGTLNVGCKIISAMASGSSWVSRYYGTGLDLDDFDADGVMRIVNCKFYKHMATVQVQYPQNSMSTLAESKIYTAADHSALRFRTSSFVIKPDSYSGSPLEYRGVVAFNIPSLFIDSCEFLNDGFSVTSYNLPEISYGNVSCESTTSGVDFDISTPQSYKLTVRNSVIKNVNDLAIASGVHANIQIFGSCEADIENNTILAAGKHTFANVAVTDLTINHAHHLNIVPVPMIFNFKNNICCATKYDNLVDPALTKADILGEVNRTDPHVGDDLNFLMVYATNLILLGSDMRLNVDGNKFYKPRGTLGSRTVTTQSIEPAAAGGLESFVSNQLNCMLEDFSTRDALIAGRTMILGFAGNEVVGTNAYRAWRELKVTGNITNNHMGPITGDGLVVITEKVASNAYDGFDDADFEPTSADIVISDTPTDPELDTYWRTINIKCSGNETSADPVATYNECNDGYKFNVVSKRFFK